jgi:hypothetical protein
VYRTIRRLPLRLRLVNLIGPLCYLHDDILLMYLWQIDFLALLYASKKAVKRLTKNKYCYETIMYVRPQPCSH